ncbi:lysine-rich arabinogalactan protein 19-like isoform X2 [Miscanthus floridulus]|uniref:lysine-rich arabinogalactan protein 19-like isoform X2 n=1 Tax=Miscanthus floridulus TaxID=154761 RepID=UPI003458D6CA
MQPKYDCKRRGPRRQPAGPDHAASTHQQPIYPKRVWGADTPSPTGDSCPAAMYPRAPPPPPQQATQPPPSQPPRAARPLPRPSPRATPPLPPSPPAAPALRPGAVGPFAGDEHPPGQYAAVVPHLHPERAGILFSFSSEAPPPAATVPSSSRADEPAAVAMESTPGGTTTTTILRRKKVSSSSAKRKQSRVKQRKEQPAKRLKSPAGPMSPLIPARSTGIRMMLSSPRVSPRLMSPSTTLANSSPQPPTSALEKKRNNLGHRSPHRIKRCKLTSEIWEDFEAIYDGETVAEARCLHCHKLFKAAATNGIAAAATNATCVRG